MFTDIVGYTTLMLGNEQQALDLLNKNREIQASLAAEYRGELLKEIGDGTLLCFDSAVDAVRCALNIQQSARTIPNLELRIGIHIGDVVFRDGDVFGDGVNIASRIEPFASPRGICITEPVFQMVKNNSGWRTQYQGIRDLKNVDQPLGIYSLHHEDQPVQASVALKSNRKSIAVLPFTNISNDPEQEYFCDGLTEDILNNLTYVDDLQVVSRTSIFALKGKKENIREIGRLLSMTRILTISGIIQDLKKP